jgi:membrane fusion protein (multidrug efflux system)
LTRGVAVRASVAALLLLGVAVFCIDWQQLLIWPGICTTPDAYLDGDETQMRTQVAGYLVDVPVKDDAQVRRGELLFAIDPRDYRARVERAAAEVEEAEADVDAAAARLAQQDTRIDAARAYVAGAAAERIRAAEERVRQAGLLHTESYLARDWQSAVATDAGAAATVEGARKSLAEARAQVEVLGAQLAGERAKLEARRASLDFAKVQLNYTRIVAPFDALASVRLVRLGDYVTAGSALITLVPLGGAWAVANFREQQLTNMAPGQRASVTVDALPGVIFRGRVDSIGAISEAEGAAFPPDRAAGNFTKIVQRVPVKIVLDPRPELAARLRPGLSVEAEVDTSEARR